MLKQKVNIPKVLPPHRATVIPVLKKDRRGERSAVAWLEDALARGSLQRGDLLLSDNEASWKTEEFRALLEHHHIRQLCYLST